MMMNKSIPIPCPECKKPTKYFYLPNVTKAEYLPLYCQKCKHEFIINISNGKIAIVK